MESSQVILAHHLCDHNERSRQMQSWLSVMQLLVIVAVDPTGLAAFLMELGVISNVLAYGLQLPSSRSHESEADALGLQLVVRACRDPREAIKAHETLAAYERKQGGGTGTVTQLVASHPPTLKRLKALQEQLPEAEKQYKKSGCSSRKAELWRAVKDLAG